MNPVFTSLRGVLLDDRPSTARDAATLGLATALTMLGALIALDLAVPPGHAVLTSLFGLAPLVACAVVPTRQTAAVAVAATLAAVFSGVWNEALGTSQHHVRIVNVALVGGVAVAIAAVRVQREQRFAQMAKIAQVAQRAILPVLPARVGPVAIASRYQSAVRGAMVGGDLFDCYHSTDHARLLIGDVRGKGIAGVEQAARVIRAFRQSAGLGRTLADVAVEMDDYLAGFFEDEEFVTALLVDVAEPGVLRLVSAGHPGPHLVRSTGAETVETAGGLPLGLGLGRALQAYTETQVTWSPGDRVLMYTDGLSEARDTRGDFLPVAALDDRVRAGSLTEAIDEVLDAVSSHVRHGHLEDDLAVVLLEHLPVSVDTADDPYVASATYPASVATAYRAEPAHRGGRRARRRPGRPTLRADGRATDEFGRACRIGSTPFVG